MQHKDCVFKRKRQIVKEEVCVSAYAESSFAVPAFYSYGEVCHVPGTWPSTKHSFTDHIHIHSQALQLMVTAISKHE